MDKTVQIRQRRGVALLITLLTIAMIITLIGVLFSALDSARKDSKETTALIQANIYTTDIENVFNSLGQYKKTVFGLLYTASLPFTSEDGSVMVSIGCEPRNAAVNINWLGAQETNTSQPDKSEVVDILLDKIALNYNLSDPELLREMILSELGSSNNFIPKYKSRLLQKGGIISYQQFERILSRYQREADDEKAQKVPWSKLLTFDPEAKEIDPDYMSAELIALFFDELDLSQVQREWIPGPGAWNLFVEEHNLEVGEFKNVLSKSKEQNTLCNIYYGYGDEQYRFSFVYTGKGVKHFEFYGRQ